MLHVTAQFPVLVVAYEQTNDPALRLRLDTSQLPKPLQIDALGSSDWNLGSDWYRWTFKP